MKVSHSYWFFDLMGDIANIYALLIRLKYIKSEHFATITVLQTIDAF